MTAETAVATARAFVAEVVAPVAADLDRQGAEEEVDVPGAAGAAGRDQQGHAEEADGHADPALDGHTLAGGAEQLDDGHPERRGGDE
jgi:hypothetical protein